MAKKYKIKRLSDGIYQLDETLDAPRRMIIEKSILERAIISLKQEIAEKQALLAYKEELLEEINKIP